MSMRPGLDLLRGRRSRKEIERYRREMGAQTATIDALLVNLVQDVDALRRRSLEPEEGLARLTIGETELDRLAEEVRAARPPRQLKALHAEYEANLERALRGIVTVERGCILARGHRQRLDEEEIGYTRGHLNMLHAQIRMAEVAAVLSSWAPGRPATADVRGRLQAPPRQ